MMVWLGACFAVAYKLTRRVNPITAEPAPELTWGKVEPLRLTTSDQQDLGAWFIPGQPDRPICLMLHGNGKSRTQFLTQAEIPARVGCGILMVTLRAHGDSSGDHNDIGYSARHDVVAAIQWLEENHSDQPVVIFGQSLGSAAALFAAEELKAGNLGRNVRGYILDCPYRDLRTAVYNRMTLFLPPVLGELAYLGISTVSPLVIGNIDRIAPIQACGAIPEGIPVLILAGGADRKATPDEAKDLTRRLGDRARLVLVEGGEHGELHQVQPPVYHECITEFCQGIECPKK
jgi:pimeloyl-ACP methyl ester carboxylesterase